MAGVIDNVIAIQDKLNHMSTIAETLKNTLKIKAFKCLAKVLQRDLEVIKFRLRNGLYESAPMPSELSNDYTPVIEYWEGVLGVNEGE